MAHETVTKTFVTSLIKTPATALELEFNELKLNALIGDIEREILAIRAEKIKCHFAAQELAKTRLEEELRKVEQASSKSWWSKLFAGKSK